MTDRSRIFIFASAATLALALSQPVAAEGDKAAGASAPAAPATAAPGPSPAAPAAAAPGPAPAAPAPAPATAAPSQAAPAAPPPPPAAEAAPAPTDADSAHAAAVQRMEQRIAEMNAERDRRYAELRQHAAEVGIELPETPPWNEVEAPGSGMPSMPSDMGMPAMPGMPADRDAARDARYQAMRERAKARGMELPETPPYKLMTADEHRAQMERMRNMTPEERMAARAETYKQLRERAAARGIDLPETPPWEQAAQRRKAMQEKWDAYRKEVDAMTDAQREAAQAMFGARPGPEAPQMPMQPPMQRPMPMDMPGEMPMDMPMPGQGPRGFGPGPCPQGDCGGMMPPRGTMPGWGGGQGSDQAPPPPQGGYGAPWGRGY